MNPYNLVPALLVVVPEIKGEYEKMAEQSRQARERSTEVDHEVSKTLATMYSFPQKDEVDIVGHTIVLETLFVPFTMFLLENKRVSRLCELTDWVEDLVQTRIPTVTDTIGVSVVEPWLTTYGAYFPKLFPYLGSFTKQLCREVATGFRLQPAVEGILHSYDD